MSVLARFGLTRRINAAGTLTRLGGRPMAPEVASAMAEAAGLSLDIASLQQVASDRIAATLGSEAAMVTTGAAAALTLAAAACLAGDDFARMAALPFADAFPNEILLPRTHRTMYSHALAAAGARLVDLGHNDRGTGAGVRGLEPWEIDAAITPRTAAFAFTATPETIASLPAIAAHCRARGLPVIVDAAAQLPPRENLRRLVAMGADLVCFSGGKAIGGPQASGILAGRADLVGSALAQQLDMDIRAEAWTPPPLLRPIIKGAAPPHGIGRGFKAGKEEIIGLLVALERFASADEAAETAALEARLRAIAARLDGLNSVRATLSHSGRAPVLVVALEPPTRAASAVAALLSQDPPVHVGERRVAEGVLLVDPQSLQPEDDTTLAAAIRAACASG
ncbi:aminotransferase class V-fold PLP-dependent enzyme [Elioraea rosea]|uniref:aminotransferase class V-fold PLP-dependent enzyme n=1 Tax=Elioraea rosea TaxID=2492390 RepID=UPI001182912D|nr:aminotransferase class V-fold PLP-dependent enzyme [Elioraea rosea]